MPSTSTISASANFWRIALRRLVFRRVVAVLRRLQRGELDHHVARPALAFGRLIGAAARQELRAELVEGGLRRRDIVLVAFGVAHIDMRDPVSLRHLLLLRVVLQAAAISARIACGRRAPVGAPDDRPRHDEMAGAGADRVGRRHHALLVAMVGAGRPDAGRHHRQVRPDDLAHGGRLARPSRRCRPCRPPAPARRGAAPAYAGRIRSRRRSGPARPSRSAR